MIMRGPRPSGDGVLDSLVTGDGISMGTSSQWGCRNIVAGISVDQCGRKVLYPPS